ncbi:DUF4145 domain-containing protein [uncultured Tateyamaria sp.]|uniref:DUF4145 domain-containing protein n=1 Tax=uncultured Tateyamaria sp. TaxID=455651 RepID=UPI00262E508E|nr:DUF4145 domain-containing protein [uncultured Tateyamaria sp.]
MTAHAFIEIDQPVISEWPGFQQKPKGQTHEAVGRCRACKSLMLVYFEILDELSYAVREFSWPQVAADVTLTTFSKPVRTVRFLGTIPHAPRAEIPPHIPANVERSFLGAEHARMAQLWTEAAASYGKAIDRGITPLVPDDGKRRTLGQKLYWLRENGNLAQPLIEWIGVILEDRNFAAHDDDRDFESDEEITTIRDFANILLTYLYTMPKRVEIARGETQAEDV